MHNPAFEATENDSYPIKPPSYHHDGMATSAHYNMSRSGASKSWKCLYVVMGLAFLVNFLLVIAVGGGLYYHQQRISEVDNKVNLISATVNSDGSESFQGTNTNVSGPPGPTGPAGKCQELRGSIDLRILGRTTGSLLDSMIHRV